MPVFRPGIDQLTPGMTGHPILFHARIDELVRVFQLPSVDPSYFGKLWDDGDKPTSRLKSWGHDQGKLSPHWISTRNGTPMHTDPGFGRYALQIQLYNDGFLVHGVDDKIEDMPLFTPGLVTILDTFSPHQVSRDPRLPNTGNSKLALGWDWATVPDAKTALPVMLAKMKRWSNELPGKRAAAELAYS